MRVAALLLLTAMVVGGCASAPGDPASPTSAATSGVALSPTGVVPTTAGSSPAQLPTTPPLPTCSRPDTLIALVIVDQVVARAESAPDADVVASFKRINPQGSVTVFDVEATVTGSDGETWHQALLPIRPNGTSGFIPGSAVTLTQTSYWLRVDMDGLKITLGQGCEEIERFQIGLGAEGTPTPDGTYYLISLLQPPNPYGPYGTFAYGLSAYSEVITNWEGGGVVGLHGTNDPDSIGDRQSHGCIRMRNEDIEELVAILPLGTPVEIG